MDSSRLPEPLRARLAARDAQPPLDKVRAFLRGYVADADGLAEIRFEVGRTAQVSTVRLEQDLAAIDEVLAGSYPPGTLLRLVAGDGNWPLDDDPTDAGAARFLNELAGILHSVFRPAS